MKSVVILSTILSAVVVTAEPVPFADPFILYDGGQYYAYGTHSPSGIAVMVSDDLRTWHAPDGTANTEYLALNKEDSYGEDKFWAPEVYRIGDKYLMYYAAGRRLCVASSSSPVGPFRQAKKEPIGGVPTDTADSTVDSHLFRDDDGKAYLFWASFNWSGKGGVTQNGASNGAIWMAELVPDFQNVQAGTAHKIAEPIQPWELKCDRVNEGPFVIKHGGVYYLTYSGNGFTSPLYGVGYATAKDINGPWTKSVDNPILQSPDKLRGTAHHAIFSDRDGKLRIVFHSHNSLSNVHPRIMHIGTCAFEMQEGEPDRLVVGKGSIFTPSVRSLQYLTALPAPE